MEDTYKGQVDNPLSLNRYTYTHNNPLRYIDPTGHTTEAGTGGIGGSVDWSNWKPLVELYEKGYISVENAPPDVKRKILMESLKNNPATGDGRGGIGNVNIPVASASKKNSFSLTKWTGKVVNATVDSRKFTDYLFKDGATHGKDVVYRNLGYGKEHSEALIKLYQEQAAKKYAAGQYTLGKKDQYGQRIDIEIELPGIGDAAGKTSYLRSGWMIREDGSITLNTPFTGFTR